MESQEGTFNELALALFAYQYAQNAPYRRLCESYGASPESVKWWQDIPTVPAQAFKVYDLSCVPIENTVAVFYSSGTTGQQASSHYFDAAALSLYETSLRRGFSQALPNRPAKVWALMPPPQEAIHSSLSHMLGTLGTDKFFWDTDSLLAQALDTLTEPVTLFGTAFAFVQLFDSTPQSWHLPSGSVVIETGGFKGRTREVPRDEFYTLLTERFGVSLGQCYSEYGMSELASQFYGQGLDPVKRGPQWVRTRAIDPDTGSDARPGQPGLLRHYDLANLNSVLAVQTQDLGIITQDGFILQGRASNAEVRGCSLTVEELWQSRLT